MRAAVLYAAGIKLALVRRAVGDNLAAILLPAGRRAAAFRDAEARERMAEAEGKATEVVSDAISKGNVQAINYFVAQKYIDALGKLAESPNQKLVLMPLEAANVIGAIGGITELAKQAMAQQPKGPWEQKP
jgi:regulator of protease activity HflC (stomatin/prohibitin superfamily)